MITRPSVCTSCRRKKERKQKRRMVPRGTRVGKGNSPLATTQRRGGESGARCINDALLGYSIGLVARVHKFVYKSHRSSSEVTARINFALAATPAAPMRAGATGRRTTRARTCAPVRTKTFPAERLGL